MFFNNFELLCKNIGKSTTAVGEMIGISKTTMSYWRNNCSVIPKQEVLLKIADYFNVSVDYLLGKTEQKNKAPSENGTLNDNDIKVALFGGDAEDISDKAWNEVKTFAQKVAEIEKMKKGYNEE